ncbi:MAG: DUF1318 domain-containing protein [Aquificota bacterium]|nr:MAG: DUF1318 domain-containing protein [Aquificota bacterium]
MKGSSRLLVLVFAVFFVLSCVTVNIYFPAAEAQRTAREIVNDVRGVKVVPEKEGEKPQSFFWIGVAHAGEEALEVSNATIRALKASLKERYPKLEPYLASGVLGESLDGFLVLKNAQGLGLKERAVVKRLVEAENGDRKALYEAVAQALDVDESQMPRSREIFSKEWGRTAPPGTWVEVKHGEWKRK